MKLEVKVAGRTGGKEVGRGKELREGEEEEEGLQEAVRVGGKRWQAFVPLH